MMLMKQADASQQRTQMDAMPISQLPKKKDKENQV